MSRSDREAQQASQSQAQALTLVPSSSLPPSPFVTTTATGLPVTMATFIKQNPPNGVPMSSAVSKRKKRGKGYDRDSVASSPVHSSPARPEPSSSQTLSRATPPVTSSAPKVTIVDGKLIIDEDSLMLSRVVPDEVHAQYERVEETSQRITSSSFRKSTYTERWAPEETELFFEGLSVWGTDFGLIARFMPGRTREQVKNKYKREERTQPSRVHQALRHRKPYDPAIFGPRPTASSSTGDAAAPEGTASDPAPNTPS